MTDVCIKHGIKITTAINQHYKAINQILMTQSIATSDND